MLANRFAVALGLGLGVVASQAPEYAQQYRQRLGGAIDELTRIVAQFDGEAATQNLSRDQGIARLKANPDYLVQRRGEDLADDAARLDRLKGQQAAYDTGGPVSRLVSVANNFDPTIARAAYRDYQPAVPVTTEGFVSAGVGLVLGWLATHLVAWPFRRRVRPGMKQAGYRRV